jgi:hypothetical protein
MKGNTLAILKMESSTEKDSLNGRMVLHIEATITKGFVKDMASTSIIKIQAYQEVCGKREF